mmetsp:Transcript_5895/g.17205  ORF Transcript_5895/g.17205 Transcript_5895/m.17205 type:complete len:227 (+) Transcript_5895:478-1158(+)
MLASRWRRCGHGARWRGRELEHALGDVRDVQPDGRLSRVSWFSERCPLLEQGLVAEAEAQRAPVSEGDSCHDGHHRRALANPTPGCGRSGRLSRWCQRSARGGREGGRSGGRRARARRHGFGRRAVLVAAGRAGPERVCCGWREADSLFSRLRLDYGHAQAFTATASSRPLDARLRTPGRRRGGHVLRPGHGASSRCSEGVRRRWHGLRRRGRRWSGSGRTEWLRR